MTSPPPPRDDPRAARALGLKPAVYAHLRDAIRAGEAPVWLRCGDPFLAGSFPNPFGFELLLERLGSEESLERRRMNLLRALADKGRTEVEAAVEEARDEGELEDLSLALRGKDDCHDHQIELKHAHGLRLPWETNSHINSNCSALRPAHTVGSPTFMVTRSSSGLFSRAAAN